MYACADVVIIPRMSSNVYHNSPFPQPSYTRMAYPDYVPVPHRAGYERIVMRLVQDKMPVPMASWRGNSALKTGAASTVTRHQPFLVHLNFVRISREHIVSIRVQCTWNSRDCFEWSIDSLYSTGLCTPALALWHRMES